MISFLLNDQTIQAPLPPGTTVLDFVRYHKHLAGTKIGCREGDCGACTVLVGEIKNGDLRYRSMTSCLMPLANAHGKHIVTIEGLNMEELSPVQQAIVEEGGTQCGFCTVGFVVSLTGFAMQGSDLLNLKDLVNLAIASIDGNICRCTGYKSLERAAAQIAQKVAAQPKENRLQWLVENEYLPPYFLEIKKRLETLSGSSFSKKLNNGNGTFVGGGTDLFVQKPEAMATASVELIFDKKELKQIYEEGGLCHIGAAATATDMQESPLMQSIFPKLNQYIKLVSSTPIRNMGTLGGNLVNASPIGDLTIFFLALDSSIVLNKNGNKRTLKLRHFYKAYKTLDKAPDEYVESIFFEIPEKTDRFNFEKICKRTHLDIASVNTGCLLKMDGDVIREAHLSAGGVGPVPMYLERSSAALKGQKIDADIIKKTATIIQEEISPISDARGTKEYKRLLLQQLFFGHFLEMEGCGVRLEELVGKST